MPELIVLGTAASVPDAEHDTVGLALRGPGWAVPVDCGGSPLYKLARAGVEREWIQALVLTHRHADHLYGLPMLVQGLWLGGRRNPLPVYGPEETLEVAQEILRIIRLTEMEDMFTLEWHPVPLREGRQVPVPGIEPVRITATPVLHGDVSTVALRFENEATGRSIVYSADTEPCPALARLAAGADILIHEATGEERGHSSPRQAAEIAREAGVTQLVLIHYPIYGVDLEAWRAEAARFHGRVTLAHDGDVYPL
jgi:ribonuclease Z